MTVSHSQPITETDQPLYIRQYAVQLDEARKEIESLRTRLAEHEANARAYEEIIGKKTYREVAGELARGSSIQELVELWIHDGRLQTFEDRERFRKAARAILEEISK